MSDIIESMARDLARSIIAVPGFASDVDAKIAAARKTLSAAPMLCACGLDLAVGDRLEAILREIATAPEDAIGELMTGKYVDLLPPALKAVPADFFPSDDTTRLSSVSPPKGDTAHGKKGAEA